MRDIYVLIPALLPTVKIVVGGTLHLRGSAVCVVMGQSDKIRAADLIVLGVKLVSTKDNPGCDGFGSRGAPAVVSCYRVCSSSRQQRNVIIINAFAFYIKTQL